MSKKIFNNPVVTVIPGFLVKSEEEFHERLKKFIGLTAHINVDVMDGHFVPNTTWADGGIITKLLPEGMTYEAHLMVNDPLTHVQKHSGANVRRYLFHVESPVETSAMIAAGRAKKKEVFLALNPETDIARVADHCNAIDGVLVMGNTPGFSGKPLDRETTTQRLQFFRDQCPALARSVDIGVNGDTARILREAGATELVSTSYLTSQSDITKAIQNIAGA